MKLISQGAESKIYIADYLGLEVLVKERFSKKYRHKDLDAHLTKERMKAECRNVVRCKQAGIKTPAIYCVNWEKKSIYMEYLKKSMTVKEYIYKLERSKEENSKTKLKDLSNIIGETLGKMHSNNIIHGDLTTSNMLIDEEKPTELIMIDFGLSHSDASPEDKGVDLYVLERAILSTHSELADFFQNLINSYSISNNKQSKAVLDKLEEIRARGRKRSMVG